jgi:sulfonate transport system substrate-binding protein
LEERRPEMPSRRLTLQLGALGATALLGAPLSAARAADLDTVTLDWAYYNPVSLVLKRQGWLEEELKADGIDVRWVQSLGSNKALEFLHAGSLDFGSTAGAAALLAKINGNPIETVWVYSKPEWTALVTRPDTGIAKVEDLKGKRIAVTKGTDPFIFLLRALDQHGLGSGDVSLVLLQHDQGRLALERGDVDAWAGLDPMMADVELSRGFPLFYRDPDANTYGVLNVRTAFAAEHPEVVQRVLAVYERGRRWALANPGELATILAEAAKLPEPVAARQLERTQFVGPQPGDTQRSTILAAGEALQGAGIVKPDVDVAAAVDGLLQPGFAASVATGQRPRHWRA